MKFLIVNCQTGDEIILEGKPETQLYLDDQKGYPDPHSHVLKE